MNRGFLLITRIFLQSPMHASELMIVQEKQESTMEQVLEGEFDPPMATDVVIITNCFEIAFSKNIFLFPAMGFLL